MKISINVITTKGKVDELTVKIDLDADMNFYLNQVFLFKVNCCEMQKLIDAFQIKGF